LTVLEAKMAQEGLVLTEAQLRVLESKKENLEAQGEIESMHPGYLGCQDTYYVCNFKGIGRVYGQTYIDSYTRVADAKLYTQKTAIAAAEMGNDLVFPFYQEQGVEILRILTDRGREYKGKLENHSYELYLSVEGIEDTLTKAYSRQTNGICERFHKTMKTEFYDVAMPKKIYTSLEELQKDLDEWLYYYNHERSDSGKYCYGKTPMQTFQESKYLSLEKSNELMYLESTADSLNLSDNTLSLL
jgi:hypothetical protein